MLVVYFVAQRLSLLFVLLIFSSRVACTYLSKHESYVRLGLLLLQLWLGLVDKVLEIIYHDQ